MMNGEDFDTAQILSGLRTETYKNLLAGYDYLFIDEAQNIPDIGKALKLIVDTQSQVAVFATGSSSFDLRHQIGEPLTGRSRFFTLHPLTFSELGFDFLSGLKALPALLVYGSYPQVAVAQETKEKRQLLESIRNGYLLKDVLQLENTKDSLFVNNLLRQLSWQIGNDISYSELASNLGTTVKTIKRYLDILEKAFVIFPLIGYSRNLRKEFTKSPRYFFWDNGIRNAVISNFGQAELREDMGKLWENFCIAERIKKQQYEENFANFYFWRTYDQQEIDLIEEIDGQLYAWEFKWGNKKVRPPKAFLNNYPDASFNTINRESFYDYLG
jgi:predicted AAA+ superfamily ATPase